MSRARDTSAFLSIVAVLLTATGVACVWHALTNSAIEPPRVVQPLTQISQETAPRDFAVVPQSIETIEVGQRVYCEGNPTGERDERFGDDVDPAGWRKMVLSAPKRDGSRAAIEMLRPLWWLEERQVRTGRQVDVEVPECGIEGRADVLAVEPCPPVAPGLGRVVTATFRHRAARTVDVRIVGQDEPIGTTPNHPFWSATQQDFVRADQLRPGEQVQTLDGLAEVAAITPRGPPEPVFNLEVHGDHVYHVGHSGVLVHNGGLTILDPCFKPSIGSYTVQFQSGYRYHGKGPPNRALQSAAERAAKHDDVVESINWRPAASERRARIDEALRILNDDPAKLYNEINPPGLRYLFEDGVL